MTKAQKTEDLKKENNYVIMLSSVGHSKLEAAYSGPYLIEEKLTPATYNTISTLGRSKTSGVVHANILKTWKNPSAEVLVTSVIQGTGLQDEGRLEMVKLQRMNDVKLSTV